MGGVLLVFGGVGFVAIPTVTKNERFASNRVQPIQQQRQQYYHRQPQHQWNPCCNADCNNKITITESATNRATEPVAPIHAATAQTVPTPTALASDQSFVQPPIHSLCAPGSTLLLPVEVPGTPKTSPSYMTSPPSPPGIPLANPHALGVTALSEAL